MPQFPVQSGPDLPGSWGLSSSPQVSHRCAGAGLLCQKVGVPVYFSLGSSSTLTLLPSVALEHRFIVHEAGLAVFSFIHKFIRSVKTTLS